MKFSFFTCLLWLSTAPIFCQQFKHSSRFGIRGGMTVGSPIILKNIPEGATGRPGIGSNIGVEYSYLFHPRFSVSIGASYVQKGSRFSSPVEGKYDAARGVFGEQFPFPLRVKYTGNVEAAFDMAFLDFPAIIHYHFKKLHLGLGYQYSKMLKGKLDGTVDVKALFLKFNDRSFDQSTNIKEIDHAAIFRIRHPIIKRIHIAADIVVSTQRLLIEPEEGFNNPRNVFLNFTLGFDGLSF